MYVWYESYAGVMRIEVMSESMDFHKYYPPESCLMIPPFTWDCDDPYGR